MDPQVLAALGLDPNDPTVQALYAQQMAPQPVEQAPAPEAAQQPIQPDSINDGINSVGRPLDIAQGDAAAQAKLDDDYHKRYKKLLRQGKGEALLALGAQLLSGRNFGESLSKGLVAYQATLNGVRDRLKPKIESVGNGTFERRVDPITGEPTYTETPVAQFERDKINALTDRQLTVQGLRNEGSQNVAEINTGSRERIADLQWTTRKDIANLQANTARYSAQLRADTAKTVAEINAKAKGRGGGRATAAMLKLATEHQGNLNTTTMAMQNLAPVLQDLETGQLTLSLGKNAMRKLSMATGVGGTDPETQKYAVMRQVIEQNRNAILIAAKGVQTEGDAQRAMAQILSSDANTATVKTQFKFLMDILKRSAENERKQLGMIRDNSGLSIPGDEPAPKQTSSGVSWRIVQ